MVNSLGFDVVSIARNQ